ncbi:MAG: hypothetical protein RR821_09080 [Clostridia bacterium]
MPSEIYEVVAQAARYWFLFLMALIVWRSYRWYRKDRKQRKKRLRLLPDAGYVGELVVLTGNESLKRGTALPVPCEGTLGFLRTNDLCVPVTGVSKKHLWFRFDEGEGLRVEPFYGKAFVLDGLEKKERRNALYMLHGSRLVVGEAELRLRLFAGFEASAPRRMREDAADGEGHQQKNGAEGAAEGVAEGAEAQGLAMQQLWMQQQYAWQLAQQQAYQQWLTQQQGGAANAMGENAQAQPRAQGTALDENDEEAACEPIETAEGVFATAASYAKESAYAPARRGAILSANDVAAAPAQNPMFFESDERFDASAAETMSEGTWPYAPVPKTDAVFENQGYTYPEYVEPDDLDEDMTDAAAPPKSAYIGHDEAELAKKKLWDKYLGGGHKR